jgi:hypothetical protein
MHVIAINKRVVLPLALALGALGLMIVAEAASATHVRPRWASLSWISLVPAYEQCTAPNRTHGPPLAFQSCNPPVQASDFLTVGTPDANGAPANATGFMKLKVKSTPPEDLLISTSISDVRCRPATDAGVCNSANAADGPDYSGQLQSNATLRISDHYNGPNYDEAATVVDIPFPVNYSCFNTSDTSVGSTCTVNTTTSALIPNQDWYTHQRVVVEITQIQVFDGGPDGNVATNANDNTLFEVHGLFFP